MKKILLFLTALQIASFGYASPLRSLVSKTGVPVTAAIVRNMGSVPSKGGRRVAQVTRRTTRPAAPRATEGQQTPPPARSITQTPPPAIQQYEQPVDNGRPTLKDHAAAGFGLGVGVEVGKQVVHKAFDIIGSFFD